MEGRRHPLNIRREFAVVITMTMVCLFGAALAAFAQDTAILMPEQSTAKAKQLLQQTIEAYGGDAYLNMRDITCSGRSGQFGHSGELNGFETFVNYVEPPNMDRTENLPKRD